MARRFSTKHIADHDLLKGYAANVRKYRDDLAAGRREALKL